MARILIVDDYEPLRSMLGAMLDRVGHETITVSDGEEAVEVFHSEEIDVVVTDLQMPGMGGLELIARLKNGSPRPTIIAFSGAGYHQLEIALAAGADATLAKPVGVNELLAAIAMAVTDEE